MKVLIAITCLAFVASMVGANPVPQSIGGSLLRSNSHLWGRFADGYDRVIQRIRSFSPLGLLRIEFNSSSIIPPNGSGSITIGTTTAATATAPPAGPIPSTVAPPSTPVPPTTLTSSFVNCSEKTSLEKMLSDEQVAKKASHELIWDTTTGLKKALNDADTELKAMPTDVFKQIDALEAAEKLAAEEQTEKDHIEMIRELKKALIHFTSCA